MGRVLLLCWFLGLSFASSLSFAQDLKRGLRNYQAILKGSKTLKDLTNQERQEVYIIHRRVQAQRYRSSGSQECQDAVRRAADAASELADYSRRLRNCAEAEDFTDDCSSEFSRVRSAHSDYEDATSSVSSYCR
jgi:hypothetical protein